jgi:hypothetical protein
MDPIQYIALSQFDVRATDDFYAAYATDDRRGLRRR